MSLTGCVHGPYTTAAANCVRCDSERLAEQLREAGIRGRLNDLTNQAILLTELRDRKLILEFLEWYSFTKNDECKLPVVDDFFASRRRS